MTVPTEKIEDNEENRNKDFADLLPSKIDLANRIIDGILSKKGDGYKYLELAINHTIGKDGYDNEITFIWNGAEEVSISDWNYKIEDYVAKEAYLTKEFEVLINECGLLTDSERQRVLGNPDTKDKPINEIAMNYIAKQLYLKGKEIFEHEKEAKGDV